VGLHVEILNAWSRDGALVVDGFLGSGTTMLACELAGRICYGVELSTSYVGVILDRMSDLGCKPELEQ
jgi:DNA modification methylase